MERVPGSFIEQHTGGLLPNLNDAAMAARTSGAPPVSETPADLEQPTVADLDPAEESAASAQADINVVEVDSVNA